MKRFLAVAMAMAFVSTAGLAAAQRVTSEISDGWVGDEPNTPAGGALPFCYARGGQVDPSCDYPADANGLGAARGPTGAGGSPGLVLVVNWQTSAPIVVDLPVTPMLMRFAGTSLIVPGFGQFTAWYGTFQDLNGNGWIEDHLAAHRATVDTKGGCETQPRTDDPNGLGRPQGLNTGVSARCAQPEGDEWKPVSSADPGVIAAYVTPGDFNDEADWVNAPTEGTHNDTSVPDFFFTATATEGEPTGRYFAPRSNFEYVAVDSGFLETMVIEAISNPVVVTDAERTHEAAPSPRTDGHPESLVEVDVYTAVDPALESVYETTVVQTFTAHGCDVDFTYLVDILSPGPFFGPCGGFQQAALDAADPTFQALVAAAEPVTTPVNDTLRDTGVNDAIAGIFAAQTDPMVGPVWATMFRRADNENGQKDFSDPHLYLDQQIQLSVAWSAPVSNNGFFPGFSGAPDGEDHAWVQSTITARLGVWHDRDGDGYVGTFPADTGDELTGADDDGCPDVHDCGWESDPNDFTSAEFTGACGAKETETAGPLVGSYYATLSTLEGTWGLGVYVVTDRRNALNANDDNLRDDGRSTANPYDDLVLDLASDGDLDALHTNGPLRMHMGCSANGAYQSYERLIVLDGVNRDYTLVLTGSTTGNFVAQGVPAGEVASDTDIIGPWGL